MSGRSTPTARPWMGPERPGFVCIPLAFSVLAVAATVVFRRGHWKHRQV